jgi:hypothetical protein
MARIISVLEDRRSPNYLDAVGDNAKSLKDYEQS